MAKAKKKEAPSEVLRAAHEDRAPWPVPQVDRAALRAHARGKVLWLVPFEVQAPEHLKGTVRLLLQEGDA